eukprot:TRINITY_DN69622_c0_g1_i1.p1 TRINITY_DN69622_c0_g1~~TRINITY_DN69622_c0_g1_i1.p1  ORF type:complete len:288 (+),score=36.18 TRINITY_DN69622_c0_g1_i1:105-968(+)
MAAVRGFRLGLLSSSIRRFSSSNFVVVDDSKRWGQVAEFSKSGKTVVVKFADQEERHPVDLLKVWQPRKARIFINGDAMPKKQTLTWLEQTCRSHKDVLVWKAIGASLEHMALKSAEKLRKKSGLPSDNVQVVHAQTQCSNATDALLTALYGRYAQSDAMNYVLSSDKKWFSELPHAFPDVPTVWLTFSELENAVAQFEVPRTWPHLWTPGTYKVIQQAAVTRGFRRHSSEYCTPLEVGAVVKVVEVKHVNADNRIRGRLQESDGWISLWDTGCKNAWALPTCSGLA